MKLHMMRGVLGGVAIAALGALGWLAGCSDNPPGPASPVASLTVTPDAVALLAPGTVQLSAVVRDANGKVLAGRPITWASDNAAVATVDGNGMVSGIGEGVATTGRRSTGATVPIWWPDGQKIAFQFVHVEGGILLDVHIYVMNADGWAPIRLTNDLAADWSPAWSPGGNRIAFQFGGAENGE